MQTDLSRISRALSDAVDLVGVDQNGHGKRVAMIASRCAEALDLDTGRRNDLLHAALLHDCGVSSTRVHARLTSQLNWAGSDYHCQRGAALLDLFAPFAHLAPVVRLHHTLWCERDTVHASETDFELANCIFLADRADALLEQAGGNVLVARQTVRRTVQELSGRFFAPRLVEAFLAASSNEAFWLNLGEPYLHDWLGERHEECPSLPIDMHELKQLARLFGRIVDAKSRFTAEHSLGVARLAAFVGRLSDLPEERCDLLEVAGLLHDVGKLRVPDAILDKPGPLDGDERALMARHSFDSYQVLKDIPGLDEVALWAGSHHETLDGGGYPFRLHDGQLPLEARILSVADIFQALAQDRPYRGALAPDAILDALEAMTSMHRLDRTVVDRVARNLGDCWAAATAAPPAGFARPRHAQHEVTGRGPASVVILARAGIGAA